MIGREIESPEELNPHDMARLIIDMFHRTAVHYTLWFREVEHQIGFEKALDIMDVAYRKSYDLQIKRLAEIFDFEMKDGIPKPLVDMSGKDLLGLMGALCKSWIAIDGVWFQAVEAAHGMDDAKRCNDSCWIRFSPFEAWSIKRFLGLPRDAGIEGLKKALQFRMYARINVQTVIEESPETIVLQMNDCRVQTARKRRGLDDYPCKSGGTVEYKTFAEAIDKRITMECIGCPPDPHPEEWFCAWRFTIE